MDTPITTSERDKPARRTNHLTIGALIFARMGHWAAWNLLPYYGAIPVRSRVVVDGNLVTAAGVTAGLDAALVVASLLCGDEIAQEIQLSIEYAPNPVFHSGTPEQAPTEVFDAFNEKYAAVAVSREAEARRFAAIPGVAV